MKKSYLVMAAAAALFAACSSNDLAEEKQSPQITQQTDELAVAFDAYTSRGTTRAGMSQAINTDKLKESTSDVSASNGFGVFGYYTNNVPYGQTAIPDFFYNQKVYWNATKWDYSPIKYWPNEFGTGAESTGQDKLTFFAYAPYVQVNTATGRVTGDEKSGIVGMTSNSASGDPYIKYIVDFNPDNSVDLCYGVANSNFTSSVDGDNNNVEAGKPYIDVIKPKVTDMIHFNFKHALASLNVQIDADVDELSHGNVNYLDGNTKIYVRKVTFEGFAEKGSLNLNSEATSVNWFELNSINRRLSNGTVTIYDGRRDGREGQANAIASNETPNALNENIIQKETETAGVPAATDPVNLFNSTTATRPIFVIPTDEYLKVTIVYDVETKDDNLSTYLSDGKTKGSSIENTITKNIQIASSNLKLAAGKAYSISLHLGMTSVKFDATVTNWPDPVSTGDTDLPINSNGTYASNTTHTISVPAAATTGGKFTITGLTESATVGVTSDGIVTSPSLSPTTITSDGNTEVTYNTSANATFYKQNGSITVTESGAGTSTTKINVIQSAQALGLSVASVDDGGLIINLESTGAFASVDDWANVAKTKWTVVKKTAAGVTSSPAYTAAGLTTKTAKITLNEAVSAGDEYIITIQTGEAAAETVTAKIGGIAFASATVPVTAAAETKIPAQTPTIYGNGIIAAGGWSSSDTGKAEIDNNTGELTIKDAGTTDVTANLTAPGSSDGYFYTTASKTAKYTLDITVP